MVEAIDPSRKGVVVEWEAFCSRADSIAQMLLSDSSGLLEAERVPKSQLSQLL